MTPTPVSRVDLRCHSSASQQSRLGIQRALAQIAGAYRESRGEHVHAVQAQVA